MAITFTDSELTLAHALRCASDLLRQEQGKPAGYREWHKLADLVSERHLAPDTSVAELTRVAAGLYRKHVIARRTVLSVARYALTEEGLRELTALDAATGATEEAALATAYRQAEYDHSQAVKALDTARRAAEGTLQRREELGRQLDELRRARLLALAGDGGTGDRARNR